MEDFELLIKSWLHDYAGREDGQTDEPWLAQRLQRDLPAVPEEECRKTAREILHVIRLYSDKKRALRATEERGLSRESWLSSEVKYHVGGQGIQAYGDEMHRLDKAISAANDAMAGTIFIIEDSQDSLELEEARARQQTTSRESHYFKVPWNEYTTRELAGTLTQKVALAGLQGSICVAGFGLLPQGGEHDAAPEAEEAIRGGVESAAAWLLAGALTVQVQRSKNTAASKPAPLQKHQPAHSALVGMSQTPSDPSVKVVPFPSPLPPAMETPLALGMLACTALDTLCVAARVAASEMKTPEALREVERGAFAAVSGSLGAPRSAASAETDAPRDMAALLKAIHGPVGATIGGLAARAISHAAGLGTSRAVDAGLEKIRKSAVEAAGRLWGVVDSGGIGRVISKRFGGIGRFFSSLFR